MRRMGYGGGGEDIGVTAKGTSFCTTISGVSDGVG